MTTYPYVFPILTVEDEGKLQQLNSNIPPKSTIKDFKELFVKDCRIIISEPGNGKSRLLKELVLQSRQHNYSAIYLNLKEIESSHIEDVIKENLPRANNKPCTDISVDFLVSDNFTSDNWNSINFLCLDGLDEVKREIQYSVINKIRTFKINFPNIKLFISCRSYIFEKFTSSFIDLIPEIVTINPLPRYKIEEYLGNAGFNPEEIDRTFDKFYRGHYITIVDNPRTLEFFVEASKDQGLENALKKTKADLLEYFIYKSLESEDGKLNRSQKEAIKRVLEILALTMEINQSNKLSKDNLMTFFNDVKSNLTHTFLAQISLEDFYEHSLLIPTENSICFHNAEFQEYLAAKELSRFGKLDQVFFDLSVEPKTGEIYPGWSNTLKYLIELNPELLIIIVDFIIRGKSRVSYKILDAIILDNEVEISQIKEKEKNRLFESVIDYHSTQKCSISLTLSQLLTLYNSDSIDLTEKWHKYKVENDTTVAQGNLLLVVLQLLECRKLSHIEFWKTEFIKIVKDKNNGNRLRDISIRALTEFNDINLLRNSVNYYEEIDSSLKDTIIRCFREIDSNSFYTIDLIIHAIKYDHLSTLPLVDFDFVTQKEGFIYVFNKLENDSDFLRKHDSQSYDEYKLKRLFSNLKSIYDKDIEAAISKMLISKNSHLNRNLFLKKLLQIVEEKNPRYLFDIVGNLKMNGDYFDNQCGYDDLFEILLRPEDVEEFVKEMLVIPNSERALAVLFIGCKNSSNPNGVTILESSRKYLDSMYEIIQKEWDANRKGVNRKYNAFHKFRSLLRPDPTKDTYNSEVFGFYSEHKIEIDQELGQEDRKRLEYLVRSVLQYDFSDATIKMTKTDASGFSYDYPSMLFIFNSAMSLFEDFGIGIDEYRTKVVESIPFQFLGNTSPLVFKLVPSLSENEINYLIGFYTNRREDDTIRLTIQNFYYVCKQYDIIASIPALKEFVFRDELNLHDRIQALDTIKSLKQDFAFYQTVFLKYKGKANPEEGKLAERANSYLLLQDNQYHSEALEWRISEIINNLPADELIHEDEIISADHNLLLGPISYLTSLHDVSSILKLLDFSIEILVKDNRNRAHVLSIWMVIMAYFENLKVYNSMDSLLRLENHVWKMADFQGKDMLVRRVNDIRSSYISSIGRNSVYSDCIRKYNLVKEKSYLPISNPEDLLNVIVDVVNVDLQKWISQEGAYEILNYTVSRGSKPGIGKKNLLEELFQKTIKTQLEIFFMKRGFRDDEIRVQREINSLSGKRVDFVISYGFIGSVAIEVKLAKNRQAHSRGGATLYKKTMLEYIEGNRSQYGVLLIVQTDKIYKWTALEAMLLDIYKTEDRVRVLGLDCTG